MTSEQLEKGRELKVEIKRLERALEVLKKGDLVVFREDFPEIKFPENITSLEEIINKKKINWVEEEIIKKTQEFEAI